MVLNAQVCNFKEESSEILNENFCTQDELNEATLHWHESFHHFKL